MKAKEALNILKVSRPTLSKYAKKGLIKTFRKPNGFFEFDDDSVYKFLNRNIERKTVIYARVSTPKQKKDLENQIELLKQYSFSKGYKIHNIYSDIASGISFEKRSDFFIMLDEIIIGKIDRVIVSYKDRLSRIGFNLFYFLFLKFGTKIEVMSEVGNKKLDSEEIFEEIISMLHCYSMKMYSKRKNKSLIIGEEK